MAPSPTLRQLLQKVVAESPLIYVDCGARGGRLPAWIRTLRATQYVGFDADAEECTRLNVSPRKGHRYIPAMLGRTRERRTFFVTRNAACASLLAPNEPLLRQFAGMAPQFEVERTLEIETVPFDACLEEHGVPSPDFVELDTQGTELEILEGAQRALQETILGLQVEVEFAPMYVDQPLFADVDTFLRAHGFELFDLARYRVRRDAPGVDRPTRGQLLWGHALYLRDHRGLPSERGLRLAVIAALLDRPDTSVQILDAIEGGDLPESTRRLVKKIRSILHAPDVPASRLVQTVAGWAERWRGTHDSVLNASRGRTTWRD